MRFSGKKATCKRIDKNIRIIFCVEWESMGFTLLV
jgi:hypothetical protein